MLPDVFIPTFWPVNIRLEKIHVKISRTGTLDVIKPVPGLGKIKRGQAENTVYLHEFFKGSPIGQNNLKCRFHKLIFHSSGQLSNRQQFLDREAYFAVQCLHLNPLLMNGYFHHCQLGESTFILWGIRSDFQFSCKFLMKILLANRIALAGTPHSVASHLGL